MTDLKETINPICFMNIGIPCSGKSTFVSALSAQFPVFSSDQILEQYAAEYSVTYNEAFRLYSKNAFKQFDIEINNAINSGISFIWDQTNVSKKARRPKINKLLTAGYDVWAFCFPVDLDLALERNKNRPGKYIPVHVISDMYRTFEYPSYSEGFSSFYIL